MSVSASKMKPVTPKTTTSSRTTKHAASPASTTGKWRQFMHLNMTWLNSLRLCSQAKVTSAVVRTLCGFTRNNWRNSVGELLTQNSFWTFLMRCAASMRCISFHWRLSRTLWHDYRISKERFNRTWVIWRTWKLGTVSSSLITTPHKDPSLHFTDRPRSHSL